MRTSRTIYSCEVFTLLSALRPFETPQDRREKIDRRQQERRQQQQGPPSGVDERRRTERRQSAERRQSLRLQEQGYLPVSGQCPHCRDMQSHLKDVCSRCGGVLPWADVEVEMTEAKNSRSSTDGTAGDSLLKRLWKRGQ